MIIDKNKFWGKGAVSLVHKYKVISVLHSVHIREVDINNVVSGRLNSNYIDILESNDKINSIITLTENQKKIYWKGIMINIGLRSFLIH